MGRDSDMCGQYEFKLHLRAHMGRAHDKSIFEVRHKVISRQFPICSSSGFAGFADCYSIQGARPSKAPSNAICLRMFFDSSGPYGPVWARPGPLKSGKSLGKTHLCVYVTCFSQKSLFLTSIECFLTVLTCS